jgi:hypothetical protein
MLHRFVAGRSVLSGRRVEVSAKSPLMMAGVLFSRIKISDGHQGGTGRADGLSTPYQLSSATVQDRIELARKHRFDLAAVAARLKRLRSNGTNDSGAEAQFTAKRLCGN